MPILRDKILDKIEFLREKIEFQKTKLEQLKEKTLSISDINIDQMILVNETLIGLIKEINEFGLCDLNSVINSLQQESEKTFVAIISEEITFYIENVEHQKTRLQELEQNENMIHLIDLDAIKKMNKGLLILSERVYQSNLLDHFRPVIQKLQLDVKKIYTDFISAQIKYQEIEMNLQIKILNEYKNGKSTLSELKPSNVERIMSVLKKLNDDVLEYNFLKRFRLTVIELQDKTLEVYEKISHICELKRMSLEVSKYRALIKTEHVNLNRMENRLISLINKIDKNLYLSQKNKEIFEIIINQLFQKIDEKKRESYQNLPPLSHK